MRGYIFVFLFFLSKFAFSMERQQIFDLLKDISVRIDFQSTLSIMPNGENKSFTGSGFWMGKYIITNRHMANYFMPGTYKETNFGERSYPVRLVYVHEFWDLAILELASDTTLIPKKELEINENPELYEEVYNLSNSEGKGLRVAEGSIADGCVVCGQFPNEHIKVTMNISQGSSGSCVVDKKGRLIGMVASGGQETVNLIPAKIIIKSLNQVKNNTIKQNDIGVIFKLSPISNLTDYYHFPCSDEEFKKYNKDFPYAQGRRLEVAERHSYCQSNNKDKIMIGDILLSINGVDVGPSTIKLFEIINSIEDTYVKLKIFRPRIGEKEIELKIWKIDDLLTKKFILFSNMALIKANPLIAITYNCPTNSIGFIHKELTKNNQINKSFIEIKKIDGIEFSNLDELISIVKALYKNRSKDKYHFCECKWYGANNNKEMILNFEISDLQEEPRIISFNPEKKEWEVVKLDTCQIRE